MNPVEPVAIDEAARTVAADLLRLTDGASVRSPQTWRAVARGLGIRVVSFPRLSGPDGWYVPEQSLPEGAEARAGFVAPECPTIFVNAALLPARQARVLVHELAHDRLEQWEPPRLSGQPPADTRYYDDDPDDVHQRIARRVEELLLGEEEVTT